MTAEEDDGNDDDSLWQIVLEHLPVQDGGHEHLTDRGERYWKMPWFCSRVMTA